MAIRHVCKCGAIGDTRRCPECRRKAMRPRPSAAKRGYNERWQATRARYLRWLAEMQGEHRALCECGCGKLGKHVHHVDHEGPRGALGHDFTNLQALSASCHAKVEARERPRGWNGPTDVPKSEPKSTALTSTTVERRQR